MKRIVITLALLSVMCVIPSCVIGMPNYDTNSDISFGLRFYSSIQEIIDDKWIDSDKKPIDVGNSIILVAKKPVMLANTSLTPIITWYMDDNNIDAIINIMMVSDPIEPELAIRVADEAAEEISAIWGTPINEIWEIEDQEVEKFDIQTYMENKIDSSYYRYWTARGNGVRLGVYYYGEKGQTHVHIEFVGKIDAPD